jgi:hypothetical protein
MLQFIAQCASCMDRGLGERYLDVCSEMRSSDDGEQAHEAVTPYIVVDRYLCFLCQYIRLCGVEQQGTSE